MIAMTALTGMQLISKERKMLRWQTYDCNVERYVNPWAYRCQFYGPLPALKRKSI